MKPQDLVFIAFIAVLLYLRRPYLFSLSGLFVLLLSIPLFYFQIFFTAQRFVIYGAFLILMAIIFSLRNSKE